MATPREIFDAAYGMSKLNQEGEVAGEAGELLPLLNRTLRGLFAEGARVNRRIFTQRLTVPVSSGTWPRPAAAEVVLQIEGGSGSGVEGTKVIEVPYDQQHVDLHRPAVFVLGQRYYSRGTPADPAGGSLIFYYSARPATVASLTAPIDPLWPSQFDQLLVLEVARYLAVKDGGEKRAQEIAAFESEYQREHARYVAWLEHESTTEVKTHSGGARIAPPGIQVG
jgi:hypothetical protein